MLALMVAALVLLAGCGGSSSSTTTTTTATVSKITLTPTTASVSLNQTITFIPSAVDSTGNPVTNQTFTWASSAPTVAMVNNSGAAVGLTAGTTQITASVQIANTGADAKTNPTITITSSPSTLNVLPPITQVTVSPVSAQIAVGQQQKYTATPLDANGKPVTGATITWSISNAAVATLTQNSDGTATVTGQTAGTVTIVAIAGNIQSQPAQLTVTK